MSTKTSIKRIAAVAAVALTLGGFSAVSAHAAANDFVSLSAGTSSPARIGVSSASTTITAKFTAGADVDTVTAQVTSAPTLSAKAALTIGSSASTSTGYVAVSSGRVSSTVGTGLSTDVAYATFTSIAAATSATTFNVKLNADVAGTYQILVTGNGNTSSGYAASLISTVYSVTVAGAPTSVSLSPVAGSLTKTGTRGAWYALSLKDANGNPTVLGANEGINITDTDATTTFKNVGGSTITALDSTSTVTSGAYLINVVGNGSTALDPTDIVTVTGAGVLPTTLTTNTTITSVATTATVAAASTITITCTTSAQCVTGSPVTTKQATLALTIGGFADGSTTADVVHVVTVTNNAGLTFDVPVTIPATATTAATSGTISIGGVSLTGSDVVVSVPSATSLGADSTVSKTFRYAASTATTLTVVGASSVLSATGATNTFIVKAADQYTAAMPYVAVSVAVSGRNTVATTAIGVTDANGLISYKVVDAGTSGTKDTVSFTGAGSATAYINYGTVTVATVTVTGGSTAADAANGATNKTAINTADNGPEASAVAIKAVVKDASGNLLAGLPVTFTVDKGLIKKTASVDYSVVYTGSDGSATTYAFNWLVGKQTITATAGGVSKSDYITWAATDASSARVLSSVVNGTVITYTVADRFGNPVKGVTINQTRTGSGLFGNGSSTQDVVTGSDGTVDATFIGSGSAVATLASTYAQAYAPAGQYDFTAGDTYTAAVAGTTSGTGASLAPAGVYSVTNATASSSEATTAAQAAVDAANEATDAANAATDAANNAMDSADAAQQAALDAGDKADAALAAVTDLASKVADIATQISALSSLVSKIAASVAKISAKVKA